MLCSITNVKIVIAAIATKPARSETLKRTIMEQHLPCEGVVATREEEQ
jgi:hypothetical protein